MTDELRAQVNLMAAAAMILASAAVIYATLFRGPVVNGPQRPELRLPTEPVSLTASPSVGADTASVSLLLYADFQCPVSARFARQVLPTVMQEYVATGRVKLMFRNFSLERVHPMAFRAAEAAQCADRQGRFWRMHDLLFEEQDSPQVGGREVAGLVSLAVKAGIADEAPFRSCLEGEVSEAIRRDVEEARSCVASVCSGPVSGS